MIIREHEWESCENISSFSYISVDVAENQSKSRYINLGLIVRSFKHLIFVRNKAIFSSDTRMPKRASKMLKVWSIISFWYVQILAHMANILVLGFGYDHIRDAAIIGKYVPSCDEVELPRPERNGVSSASEKSIQEKKCIDIPNQGLPDDENPRFLKSDCNKCSYDGPSCVADRQ